MLDAGRGELVRLRHRMRRLFRDVTLSLERMEDVANATIVPGRGKVRDATV